MAQNLKLLIVEDSKEDIELILRKLKSGGYSVTYDVANTLASFNKAIEREEWNIILCDYAMPAFNGTEALASLRHKELDIPFIFVSGKITEDMAVDAMKRGASDYVMKDNLKRLFPAVEREVRDAKIRNEHRKIQKELLESKNLLDKTFKSLKEAVFIIHPGNRTIITCNPAAEQIFGYGKDELTGKNTEFLHVDRTAYEQFGKELLNKLDSEGVYNTEYCMRRKNGEVFLTENTVTEISDDQGRRSGLVSVVRDITERKEVEKALQQSETRFRKIIESVPAGFVLLSEDLKFKYASPSALNMFGYNPRNPNLDPVELTHPEDLPSVLAELDGVIKDPSKTTELQYRFKHNDGSWRWIESTFSNLLAEPAIEAVLINFNDITHRKELETKMQLHAHLLDEIGEAVMATDLEGKIFYWNKAAEELYGWAADEVIGKDIIDVTHSQMSKDQAADIMEKLRKGESWSDEFTVQRRDGSTFPALVTDSPFLDDDGQLVGIIGISIDISKRKQAEKQLQLQSAALESAANAISITDTDGIIQWANPAFYSLTGYSKEEVIGSKPDLLNSGKMDKEFFTEMWNTILSGNVWRGELINERKDGTLYDEEMTITPVKNSEGTITHFVAVKEDVSDQKELQRQLIQAQKLESIGTLASGIAHDFNNILGIILGYCTLLERSREDTDKFKKNINTITQAVKRGSNLVQQILTFARKSDVSYDIVNVNTVIRELSQMLHETFPKSVSIDLKLDKSLPAIVIDQTQLNQALLNLCVNARDAILEKEKPYGTITIRSSYMAGDKLQKKYPDAAPDKYVIISVGDTGTGLDDSLRDRIFDPFYTTKSPDKGTGLGLSLVYGVVKSCNGYIDLESEGGKGTTFTLYLPVYQEAEKKVPGEEIKDEVITRGTETVLVVEDEEMLRYVLTEILSNEGYTVIVARNGEEAVEKYKQHKDEIALVLSDVGLPKMSGIDLYKKLMQIDPYIKIILASGFIDPVLVSELYKKGIKEIIRKPYDSVDVLQRVRAAIRDE